MKKNNYISREFIAKILTALFAIYIFVFLDILNIQEYSNVMSRNLSTKFFSFYYPRKPDDIIVINTDDDSVDLWPPSYLDYSKWIEFIVDYEPKAIVFDINFVESRNSKYKDDFIEVLEYAVEQKIKVYGIVAKESDVDISKSLIPIGTRWNGLEEGYYPVISKDGLLMAATRVYNDLFRPIDNRFTTPLFIQWPSRPPKQELSLLEKFVRGVECLFVTCKKNTDEISYLDKMKAHEIFLNGDEATKAFKNRIVFFGSERAASKDFFENPIYGQVPGVFLHAMALDNLIKYNEDYFKRDDSKPIFFRLGSGGVIEIIILCINVFIFFKVQVWIDSIKIKNKKKVLTIFYKTLKWSLICTLITLSGIVYSHLILRNDPGNLVGLLASNLFIYELFYYFMLVLLIPFKKSKKRRKKWKRSY